MAEEVFFTAGYTLMKNLSTFITRARLGMGVKAAIVSAMSSNGTNSMLLNTITTELILFFIAIVSECFKLFSEIHQWLHVHTLLVASNVHAHASQYTGYACLVLMIIILLTSYFEV
jgi:hypothetical protein